jgi:hypothetical protein
MFKGRLLFLIRYIICLLSKVKPVLHSMLARIRSAYIEATRIWVKYESTTAKTFRNTAETIQ